MIYFEIKMQQMIASNIFEIERFHVQLAGCGMNFSTIIFKELSPE